MIEFFKKIYNGEPLRAQLYPVPSVKPVLADTQPPANAIPIPAEQQTVVKKNLLREDQQPLTEYAQQIKLATHLQDVKASTSQSISFSVKNMGSEIWPAAGKPASPGAIARVVNLAYRWIDATGKIIDTGRTPLPRSLAPGEITVLTVNTRTPDTAGDYTLSLTMVQEHVAWFDKAGAQALTIPLTVSAS